MEFHAPCRIVITGIGLCTPLGATRESTWQGLLAGRSATRWLSSDYWPDDSRMPGAAVCFPKNRSFQHPEPLVELARLTADEALTDAGLSADFLREANAGVVFGTSKGGLHTFSRFHDRETNRPEGCLRQRQMSDSTLGESSSSESGSMTEWLDVYPSRAAMAIREMIGGYGPTLCPVVACATGLAACLRGAELLQSGDCDLVFAGSADVSLQPALLGSFRRLGVLSKEAEDAGKACRPYDRNRSGFVIGEGAACLVLERMESALARRQSWYAEWLGGRMLSDAHSLTQLDPDGATLKRLLHDLRQIDHHLPDFISLHGTGTITNDLIECQALRNVFQEKCHSMNCSSLKGGLGHLLGAAGSVELAATTLAIRDQIVPPTVNLEDRDLECDLNLTPQTAVQRQIERAWKISMGFGGHIAGACLARPE